MIKENGLLPGKCMMKRTLLFVLYCLHIITICSITQRKCDLHLQPLWEELQDTRESTITFKGKWIHAGIITFRKKTLGPIALHTLVLHWHGPTIDNLETS